MSEKFFRAPALIIGVLMAITSGCDVEEVAPRAPEMTAVTVGELHTCALSATGAAYCWGDNASGQLGTGSNIAESFATAVSGTADFTAIDAGGAHTCALTQDGRAWCWGSNQFGQLGTGMQQDADTPQLVNTTERFTTISAGFAHSCALNQDGRAYCWGNGAHGELGGNSQSGSATPRLVSDTMRFTRISAGGRHSCALDSDGFAHCWGANEVAQLGAGFASAAEALPVPVDSGYVYNDISAGWNHSCAVSPNRVAYCWGENAHGEMGSGWDWEPGVPAQPWPQPVISYGEIMFTAVSAGKNFTCGRRDQGSLYCWGKGAYGQLGNNRLHDAIVPQWVKSGPGRRRVDVVDVFGQVSASSDSHACGLAVDGAVYCWGNGSSGQLGYGEWLSMVARPVAAAD